MAILNPPSNSRQPLAEHPELSGHGSDGIEAIVRGSRWQPYQGEVTEAEGPEPAEKIQEPGHCGG